MSFIRKHLLKISLIAILVSLGVLCIYSIYIYKGSTTNFPNNTQQSKTQQSRQGNNIGQMPSDNKQGQAAPSGNNQGQSTPNSGNQDSKGQFQNSRQGSSSSTSGISTSIIIYAVIFLILAVWVYYIFLYKKIKIKPSNERILIITLLLGGLLLRIFLGTIMEGHSGDINFFKTWATSVSNSFSQFYSNSNSSDYPPLYIYILFIIGKISGIGGMSNYFVLLLKLPSMLADIATSYVIYRLAKKYLSVEIGMILSAFYILNPAVFINSTLWGQVDSFFTLIIVLAVYLLSEKKLVGAAILFTAAILMKPQGIIFLPVIFFELVRQKKLKNFLKVIGAGLALAAIVVLPFAYNQDVFWIFKLYASTVAEYPYATVNGFNFFGLIGANYVNNSTTLFIFSYHTWGMIFIVLTTLFSWFIYIKGKSEKYASIAALIQIAGVFTFSVGMHERYLFPAIALSILAYIFLKDKRILILILGYSITVYINTHAVLFNAGGMGQISYSPLLIMTSLLNVLLFIYLVKIILNIIMKKTQLA